MQVAYLAMVGAARAYDPERGAQSTLVYHAIRNALSRFVGRTQKKERNKRPMFTDPHTHDKLTFLPDLLDDLPETERQIAQMLSMGVSQKEIMKTLDINRYEFKKSTKLIRKYLEHD
jgi:DNA-binding NarL/FixJ family response regulator